MKLLEIELKEHSNQLISFFKNDINRTIRGKWKEYMLMSVETRLREIIIKSPKLLNLDIPEVEYREIKGLKEVRYSTYDNSYWSSLEQLTVIENNLFGMVILIIHPVNYIITNETDIYLERLNQAIVRKIKFIEHFKNMKIIKPNSK